MAKTLQESRDLLQTACPKTEQEQLREEMLAFHHKVSKKRMERRVEPIAQHGDPVRGVVTSAAGGWGCDLFPVALLGVMDIQAPQPTQTLAYPGYRQS